MKTRPGIVNINKGIDGKLYASDPVSLQMRTLIQHHLLMLIKVMMLHYPASMVFEKLVLGKASG